MQALSLSFRRLYATTVLPEAAAAARTASTPRAVRLRRLRKRPAIRHGDSDVSEAGLTPTEHATYQRRRATGILNGRKGGDLTEDEWLEKLNSRRTRIRGVKQTAKPDGGYDIDVVGQKVYLPNIIFRLVRNHTPAGQPYNPYEATFRVPHSVTKTDIRSYLAAAYGVKITYVRTDNYLAPQPHPMAQFAQPKQHKNFKRAVVGLVDPFYYPLELSAMGEKERKERMDWLDDKFGIENWKKSHKIELLRLRKTTATVGWKWRGSLAVKRSAILRNVAERRAQRENLVSAEVKSIQESRAKGEAVAV